MSFETPPREPENELPKEENKKQENSSFQDMSDAYLREIQERIDARKKERAEEEKEDMLDRVKREQEDITSEDDLDLRETAKEMRETMEREELNEYLGPDLALEKLSPEKINALVQNEAERAGLSESQMEYTC